MRQKHLIFSLVFLVLLCSFVLSIAFSQTVEDLRTAMKNAEDALYHDSYGAYTSYKWSYDRLEKMITEIRADIKALGGIKLTPTLHPVTQGVDAVSKIGTAVHLTDGIRTQLKNIETQREITEMLWVGNEDWYGVDRAWVDFENAVNAYNEKVSVNRIVYPPEKQIATELYFCYGPCDELFETASLAQVSHQVYCSEKHGASGTTGVTYYICSDSGTCDRADEHWRVCGGTCGEKFAPKKVHRQGNLYVWVANSPHYVTCSHSSCGEKYYTCQYSTCPKSNTHVSSNTAPPPTDNTPNCSDCTSHCSSPCSCSTSGTCNGTVVDNTPNCSDCTSHCSSPCSCTNSGTCNGTVTPPTPTPPKPKLVACGGASYTGCTARVSSRTEHYVKLCNNCSNPYWTCSPWASRHTTQETCRRPGCGTTFYKCNNGTCTSNWGTRPSHWAR